MPLESPQSLRRRHPLGAVLSALTVAGLLAMLVAPPAVAAEGPTIEARVMLQGHSRVGAWMEIEVELANAGPALVGELQLVGGGQGGTRFSAPIDLPTQSDKVYRLYAQPPAFGRELEVALTAGGNRIAAAKVEVSIHDPNQLVVGVVAERPGDVVGSMDLLPSPNGTAPVIVSLAPADLPDRVEAWASLDRLVWQDVDTTLLSREQVDALRTWIAGGGRLVVAGGTAGPSSLAGLPDDVLPFRPTTTTDVDPGVLSGLLGEVPAAATIVPALSGELSRGRALASSGDRTIAAEAPVGSGAVTIVGFDPTIDWIAASGAEGLWRRLLPPRTTSLVVTAEDSLLVDAVRQLPALALPPVGGLFGLLAGYIVLVGPVNYLVLRRLDRREWAWVTMPMLIAVFAVGAYAFGAALRGLDVIVNEVAIVRGAPGTTAGTAQVYLGVFSPSRGAYQLEVHGGALLSSTVTGDLLAGGQGAPLDVVQGEPARVRDLSIGFGSLRTLRAETPIAAPLVEADLRLEDGVLTGTVHNRSDQLLERPAVVFGSAAVVLGDLDPGESARVSLPVRSEPFGPTLSDRIVGQVFFGDPRASADAQRDLARHGIIDQLTFDPMSGAGGTLPAESPVLLAWGREAVLDVRIEDQVPRRTGNVLYYVPLGMEVRGQIAFEGQLIRSSVVEVDAGFFGKDPYSMNFGTGSVTLDYRPIPFDGQLTAERLLLSMGFGGDSGMGVGVPVPIDPGATDQTDEPQPCDPNVRDCFVENLPSVEVFDRTSGEAGAWIALPRLAAGRVYGLGDAARYVDPGTAGVLVRFRNDRVDPVGFSFNLRIEGVVR